MSGAAAAVVAGAVAGAVLLRRVVEAVRAPRRPQPLSAEEYKLLGGQFQRTSRGR